MAANKINEIGNVYGDLTVIGKSPRRSVSGGAHWMCRCSCGNEKEVLGYSLRYGSTKSCGCRSKGKPNNPETLYRKGFRSLESGAKDRGLSVELDYDTYKLLIKKDCWFCGSSPYDIRRTYSRKSYSLGIEADYTEPLQGIDRLDSSIGYVTGNCVPCCSMCNRMKSDFTVTDFLNKIATIYKFKEKTNE